MSDLLIVIYEDERRAADVLNALRRERPRLVELENAAYVERDPAGVTRLHQSRLLTPRGPVAGSWTSLVRQLVTSAGTAAASEPLVEYGINNACVRRIATEVVPGRSALFALLTETPVAEALSATAPYGGLALTVELPQKATTRLRPCLRAGGGCRHSA